MCFLEFSSGPARCRNVQEGWSEDILAPLTQGLWAGPVLWDLGPCS